MNAPVQDAADLTPLAWVQDEVRRTLEGVAKQLRRQLREFDLRQASGQVDAAQFATHVGAQAAAVHQVAGVLQLVQLPEGQRLLHAAETLLQRAAGATELTAEQVDAVERAGFALLGYITRLLRGNQPSPLSLFPAYRVLQELNRAERIHPADFWPQHFEWRELPPPTLLDESLPSLEALRGAFEVALLKQMRDANATHATHLAELCAGLGLAFGREPQASFWQIAAAHFEAQAQGLLASDPLVKRLASRLLAQLRSHLQGHEEVADRLVQDLLFFCAQSGEPAAGQAPRLRAVRIAFGLDEAPMGDYRDDSLGRIDPAWVALAQRRVSSAKEAWSAAAEGDQARAAALDEASGQLTESLTQLFPGGELLGQTLQRAAVVTLRAGARPPAALAMEVATSLLYLEAALEDGEYDRPEQAARVQRLAQRVQAAATGQPPETLEAWVEDLFRRVADKQTLGSVVQELRVNLGEVERATDEYFRDPSKREQLIPVPGQLQAMRGVFGVLGLDQAAITCLRMRDEIDRLSNTEVDATLEGPRAIFDRLATNLGQLGFLIDMLSVQAPLAKSMFKFDEEKGELVASVERERRSAPVAKPSVEAQLREAVAVPAGDAGAQAQALERLALQAAAEDRPALAAAAKKAAAASTAPVLSLDSLDLPDLDLPSLVSAGDAAAAPELSLDLPDLSAPAAPAVDATAELQALLASQATPAPPLPESAALPVSDEAYDEEMLEIFLEEANEVIANARAALDVLSHQPGERSQLTNVRRAFHTLKGSSRMVGLNAYGEAAWACEQLMNARIADEKPADAVLLGFCAEALDELAAWRDDIPVGLQAKHSPEGLRQRADALRVPPAPVQAPPVASVAADTPEVEPEFAAETDYGTPEFAATDFPSTQPPLDFDSTQPPEFPRTQAPDDEGLSLDLTTLEVAPPAEEAAPADAAGAAAAMPVDQLLHLDFDLLDPATAPPPADEGFDIELSLPEAPLPMPAESLPDLRLDLEAETVSPPNLQPEPEPELHLNLDLDAEVPVLTQAAPEPELSGELPEVTVASGFMPEPEASPEPSPEPEAAEAQESESPAEVQIGDLHLSEALYRIFVAEAQDHSQRLLAALGDWAPLHDEPPPAATEVYAHALAGNAATVGFDSLSQLARALEHAIERAQTAAHIEELDAANFLEAATEIHGLLQAFAAAELKSAPAALIAALQAYQPTQRLETQDSLDSAHAELPPVTLAVPLHSTAAIEALALDADFPLGEADDIDPELWEIFEEEAGELLQQLHARLRDWTAHAQDASRGDACMRTLHTFKGGARLAGAMQLGELAHRLESDVLSLLARGERGAADVHPLQDRGDELEARFEALRHSRRVADAPPAPVVVAPVVEPVVEAVAEPLAAIDLADLVDLSGAVEAPPVESAEPTEPAVATDEPVDVDEPVVNAEPALPEPIPTPEPLPQRDPAVIDWDRFSGQSARELTAADAAPLVGGQALVRVRAALLDRLAAQSGEVAIRRARLENELAQMRSSLADLDDNLERLRTQMRELEVQAEAQISSRQEQAKTEGRDFDPLEFDRYTRFQEVTRMLAESVNDVATVQRGLQRNVQTGEDELAAQARLTRELQDDLLRSRMVEFESIGERLHRVVRQAARESGKQVQLDIQGQGIELDRGVLERLIGAFEHLLRNSVVHGIEAPEQRTAAGKTALGSIRIKLSQEGNQVLIAFSDDGGGLDLARIRDKAIKQGLLSSDAQPSETELVNLIYSAGFSTAASVTEIAGRGVGMDVVRSEVNTLGGYVQTRTQAGKGSEFDLHVPLTTALTQVVLLRCGELVVAVPAALIDTVLRLPNQDLAKAYEAGRLQAGAFDVPIYWLGGLLAYSDNPQVHSRHAPVVLVHSGPDRIALHVDEVVGNQEVVVKNLGPQLIHVPGLAGISLLASGSVALIYNPVALAERYGAQALARARDSGTELAVAVVEEKLAPLVLVVDDSLTVRRVSQRFLEREGYRVLLAKDGLEAMELLAGETLPDMVLSDIEMPRMDGFDLVRNIRADARLRELPVVMITSRIAEKHREYAEALGVEGYLGKPYDEDHLLRLIRQHTAAASAMV